MRKLEQGEFPVLPIGKVNLETGANKEYSNLFKVWHEDDTATNVLMRRPDGTLLVVHTAGSAWFNVGDEIRLAHDQTHRPIAQVEVVGFYVHTWTGLALLRDKVRLLINKKSIPFYTFK